MCLRWILTAPCLLAFGVDNSLAGEWERLAPLPEPNGGFVCAVLDDEIVVAGGTNWEGGAKNWLDAIHIFSTKTMTWRRAGRLSTPQAYAISGVLEGADGLPRVFIKGGTTGEGPVPEWRSISRDGPRREMPDAPFPSVLAAGGVVDGWMIQAGGTDDPANLAGLSRRTLAVKLDGGEVEDLPEYPGAAFGTAACAVTGGELFVFGGANWDASAGTVRNADEAHVFHLAKRAWRPLKRLPYPVRGLAAVAVGEGSLYLAGGYKSDAEGFTAEAWLYDTAKNEYRAAHPLPYPGMVSLVVCGGHLYCLGGEDRQKSRTDACFRMDLAGLERR